jgi:hypothetical protein
MKKHWVCLILSAMVIFYIYHIYFGFESGSINNFFDETGENDTFKVDESPVMFWLNMGFHMSGIIVVLYISIFFWRNKSSTPTVGD